MSAGARGEELLAEQRGEEHGATAATAIGSCAVVWRHAPLRHRQQLDRPRVEQRLVAIALIAHAGVEPGAAGQHVLGEDGEARLVAAGDETLAQRGQHEQRRRTRRRAPRARSRRHAIRIRPRRSARPAARPGRWSPAPARRRRRSAATWAERGLRVALRAGDAGHDRQSAAGRAAARACHLERGRQLAGRVRVRAVAEDDVEQEHRRGGIAGPRARSTRGARRRRSSGAAGRP